MAEPQTPHETSVPSQKRPLEEPSSPSGPTDGPDAKRPALDKIIRDEDATDADVHVKPEDEANDEDEKDAKTEFETAEESKDVAPAESTDKQGDTVVPDAPVAANGTAATNQILETKPVQSTGADEDTRASSQAPHHDQRDETGWLHVRAIISSAEAATVIGKGGENVSQIRRMAGAKCTVSEYSRGAVERILTVSGLVDAVAKVRETINSPI
jgi:poly(rC)-binding protein 2/3/4